MSLIMDTALDPSGILKQYFGYEDFRLGQKEVIDAIIGKRDVLAIMPTGAGKSLCFQVPAMLMDGITLVISPLISLMQDQVTALKQSGIPAAFINSSLSASQTHKALANAQKGAYKIIYVAPERLETGPFLSFAQNADITMVAVDEAHCVSHWGQDFRPSYLQINEFISSLPKRPVLSAFTATATDLVKDDIIKLLNLQNPFIRSTGFNRKNLYFEVRRPKSKFDELALYLNDKKGKSGIIYCATRKTVDDVAARLNEMGINAARYHAGMSQSERSAAQLDFLYDRVPIIIATNAFGMGIDKSNVHFVLHYNMPKNIENYYQEAGRAGRDGSPAECILLFAQQDLMINRMLIENNESTEDTRALDFRRLREIEAYCTTTDCLRQYILDYFQDDGINECGNCGNCRTEREMIDITIDAQKILSCVYRMKGRFGLALVIDVLQGKSSQRIRDMKLNSLKTYGIMKGHDAEEIRQIAYYLLRKGYMQVQGDRYPVVQISDKADEILRKGQSIEMPFIPISNKQERQPLKQKPKNASKPATEYSVDEQLFEDLRALRLILAEEAKAPAFTVFSDATLYDMCKKLPTDEEGFLKVSGVGEMKLQKYGQVFVGLIKNYVNSGAEVRPWKEPAAPQELFDNFEISEEAIHLGTFMQQANLLLMQLRGRGTSAQAISIRLEKDGYLEMIEYEEGKRGRLPTEKGRALGIFSRREESPDGRTYLRNYYEPGAQRQLLAYIKEVM